MASIHIEKFRMRSAPSTATGSITAGTDEGSVPAGGTMDSTTTAEAGSITAWKFYHGRWCYGFYGSWDYWGFCHL